MTKETSTLDDLEAVRAVVSALEKFPTADQQRILRWAQEKLGLSVSSGASVAPQHRTEPDDKHQTHHHAPSTGQDIKTFIQKKSPPSDTQFAAAVAYYHRFEAPPGIRKDSINSEDLQDACRKVGRDRILKPSQTLVNAHHQGLLDKGGERGIYTLSTVGENLVAVTLPTEGGQQRPAGKRKSGGKKALSKVKGKGEAKKRGK